MKGVFDIVKFGGSTVNLQFQCKYNKTKKNSFFWSTYAILVVVFLSVKHYNEEPKIKCRGRNTQPRKISLSHLVKLFFFCTRHCGTSV